MQFDRAKYTSVFRLVFVLIFCMPMALLAQNEVSDLQATTLPATEPATFPVSKLPIPINRFAKAIELFEKLDAKTPPPEHPTVFIGSSTFTRWRAIPEEFKDFHAINRAFGGSTLPEVIHYIDKVVFKYKPSAVVIWCGSNDIAAGASAEKVFENYVKLTDKIHAALPETQIFFLSNIPAPVRVKFTEQIDRSNELIREHISKNPHQHYIDARYVTSGADHVVDETNYIGDRLHPNEKGYALLAPVIRAALSSVLDAKAAK